MELIHARCAGLDVHKKSVVACVRLVDGHETKRELRTFGTTSLKLRQLREWLTSHQVTQVVMESTGAYWRPVWSALEGGFGLVLANAQQVRNMPGRKTDVKDAQWLAELLAHGLVRGSLVPDEKQAQVRELSRLRKRLAQEKSRHVLRIQKVLEYCNIKLGSVISDVLGQSGRRMLEALIAGKSAQEAAQLGSSRLEATQEELTEALDGFISEARRFELKMHLELIDEFDRQIASVDERLGGALEPFRRAEERLVEIPGVSHTIAQALIGEIGADMARFETPAHLRSWAKVCPRSDESAGKKRDTSMQKGSRWLRPLLRQIAVNAIRPKDSYFRVLFNRVAKKQGQGKAYGAVAASVLTTIWWMLKYDRPYENRSPELEEAERRNKTAWLVRQLHALGYQAQLTAVAAA